MLNRLLVTWLACLAATVGASSAAAQWYTRPYASRYYKDDWTAKFIASRGEFAKTIAVRPGVKVAYVQVWSAEPYALKVNGQLVGQDYDAGLVEHYEITKFLQPGDNQFTFELNGAEGILEGQNPLRRR